MCFMTCCDSVDNGRRRYSWQPHEPGAASTNTSFVNIVAGNDTASDGLGDVDWIWTQVGTSGFGIQNPVYAYVARLAPNESARSIGVDLGNVITGRSLREFFLYSGHTPNNQLRPFDLGVNFGTRLPVNNSSLVNPVSVLDGGTQAQLLTRSEYETLHGGFWLAESAVSHSSSFAWSHYLNSATSGEPNYFALDSRPTMHEFTLPGGTVKYWFTNHYSQTIDLVYWPSNFQDGNVTTANAYNQAYKTFILCEEFPQQANQSADIEIRQSYSWELSDSGDGTLTFNHPDGTHYRIGSTNDTPGGPYQWTSSINSEFTKWGGPDSLPFAFNPSLPTINDDNYIGLSNRIVDTEPAKTWLPTIAAFISAFPDGSGSQVKQYYVAPRSWNGIGSTWMYPRHYTTTSVSSSTTIGHHPAYPQRVRIRLNGGLPL